MSLATEMRIEPAAELLAAARNWLEPVRSALGGDFLAAYLTGSVLTHGFDPRHSAINVLVVSRQLGMPMLDSLAAAVRHKGRPAFQPLFATREQIESSLDVFPIEWLDIQERHLRLEGEDVFAALDVPREDLRRQCEHELRGKHLRLRQAYVLAHSHPQSLTETLRASASGMATLYRTLLRLRGETPPADHAHVTERLADLYQLDAAALLGPHMLRHSKRRMKSEEITALYRKFLVELDRLILAVDSLRVA
jgi:hypothetical protein